jgi:hypothetical protein
VQYSQLAADQNHVDAQVNYGLTLEVGIGIPVDFIEAARYYKMAADQNDARGQFLYGICLESGQGVHLDLIAACRSLKLAADHEVAEGFLGSSAVPQYEYAFRRMEGRSCRIDLRESSRYLKLAAGLATLADESSDEPNRGSEFDCPMNPKIARALYSRIIHCCRASP